MAYNGNMYGAAPRTTTHSMVISMILLLNLAGVVIAIAGLGRVTDLCRSQNQDSYTPGLITTHGSPAYQCGMYYSLDWWIVCFQVFITLLAFIATWMHRFNSRVLMLFFYAIAISLFCLFANQFALLDFQFQTGGNNNNNNAYVQGVKTALAGALIVLITDFLFAICFAPESSANAPTVVDTVTGPGATNTMAGDVNKVGGNPAYGTNTAYGPNTGVQAV
jgi:hypothetical protein